MCVVPHDRSKVLASYRKRLSASNQAGVKGHGANTARRLPLAGMEHVAIDEDPGPLSKGQRAARGEKSHGPLTHDDSLELLVPVPRHVAARFLAEKLVVSLGGKVWRDGLYVLVVASGKSEGAPRIDHPYSRCPIHDSYWRIDST